MSREHRAGNCVIFGNVSLGDNCEYCNRVASSVISTEKGSRKLCGSCTHDYLRQLEAHAFVKKCATCGHPMKDVAGSLTCTYCHAEKVGRHEHEVILEGEPLSKLTSTADPDYAVSYGRRYSSEPSVSGFGVFERGLGSGFEPIESVSIGELDAGWHDKEPKKSPADIDPIEIEARAIRIELERQVKIIKGWKGVPPEDTLKKAIKRLRNTREHIADVFKEDSERQSELMTQVSVVGDALLKFYKPIQSP